jgi:hypothetical protein
VPNVVPNVVPTAYREVSVTDVDFPLSAVALTDHFLGRECYRRTRFIVVRHGDAHALVEVTLAASADGNVDRPLFAPAIDVTVRALPEETVFAHRPELDTGVPSQLALAATEHPDARCVVVEGRYHHISFLLDPAPLVVRVVEVVPPSPAKLVDQVRRVLALAEDLPPMVVVPELVDLESLAPTGVDVLLPCRGSGVAVDGAATWYLDQRPDRHPWFLVGCQRSREVHRWFYGEDSPGVDICPRRLATSQHGALLTKCCLLEDRIEVDPPATPDVSVRPAGDRRVVVPWGASLEEVRTALRILADAAAPAWAPA